MAPENVAISGISQQDLIHGTNDVCEGEKCKKKKTWQKISLLILKTLIVVVLMVLNYLLRYNYNIRYESDMVNYFEDIISCDLSVLKYQFSWPYYNYDNPSKPYDGLHVIYKWPEWAFYSAVLLTPILTFCIVEGFRAKGTKEPQKAMVIFGLTIPLPIRRLARNVGVYLFGGSLVGLFVAVWKLNVASPRPHFMSVCNIDHNWSDPCFGTNSISWSPYEKCKQASQKIVEALKSFPSYHATLAVYMGIFTSIYILRKTQTRGNHFPSFLFIFAIMVLTLFGATHRLASCYSFPRDVIWGGFVGFVAAYFTVTVGLQRSGGSKMRRRFTRRKTGGVSRGHSVTNMAEKNQSGGERDTDLSSESSFEERNQMAQVNMVSFIPRARMGPNRGQPTQAFNPKLTNVERKSTFSSSLSSLTEKNLVPHQASSFGTELGDRRYTMPRERNPSPKSEPANFATGYNNDGFESSLEKSRPYVLAYEASRNMENTSNF